MLKRKIIFLTVTVITFCMVTVLYPLGSPHSPSDTPSVNCSDCHVLHTAAGGALTKVAGNANLCMTCHSLGNSASNHAFTVSDQAVPGTSGSSHRWDATAVSATYETTLPTNSEMALRVKDGKIMCSTCHDQHNHDVLSPDDAYPFLRVIDVHPASGYYDRDMLCIECHASRFTASANENSHTIIQYRDWSYCHTFSNAPYPGLQTMSMQRPPNLEWNMDVVCSTCHDVHNGYSSTSEMSAASAAGTTTTLNDSSRTWTVNGLVGWKLFFLNGADNKKVRVIVSNTATQLTWTSPLSSATTSGVKYRIQDATVTGDGYLLKQDRYNLCVECHVYPSNNAHRSKTIGALWPGGQYGSAFPARDASDRGSCLNCHNAHGAQDDSEAAGTDFKGLLLEESWPGGQGDEEEDLCYTCHDGSPAIADMKTIFDNRAYRHPVKDSEQSGGRSVECFDCHNQHYNEIGNHTQGSSLAGPSLYGDPIIANSYIDDAVYPATTVNGPTAWNAGGVNGALPAAQTSWKNIATLGRSGQNWGGDFEAYICFKCHSNYSSTNPGRDVELTFNPNNGRYHAVLGTSNASGNSTLTGGWNTGDTMTCSDCHSSDTAGDAAGPHGSATDKILKGAWTSTTGKTGSIAGHLCFDCHDSLVYSESAVRNDNVLQTGFSEDTGGGTWRNLHEKHLTEANVTSCRDCHGTVIHGWTWPYPLWTDTDAAPYSTGSKNKSTDAGNWGPTANWEEDDCLNAHNVCQ